MDKLRRYRVARLVMLAIEECITKEITDVLVCRKYAMDYGQCINITLKEIDTILYSEFFRLLEI